MCFSLQKWAPVADFTHHAHTASLSAVAVNSRFVVTGSKDETIHIYDMKKKVDHGALMHHNGKKIISFKITVLRQFTIRLQLNNSCKCLIRADSVLRDTEVDKVWFFILKLFPVCIEPEWKHFTQSSGAEGRSKFSLKASLK